MPFDWALGRAPAQQLLPGSRVQANAPLGQPVGDREPPIYRHVAAVLELCAYAGDREFDATDRGESAVDVLSTGLHRRVAALGLEVRKRPTQDLALALGIVDDRRRTGQLHGGVVARRDPGRRV